MIDNYFSLKFKVGDTYKEKYFLKSEIDNIHFFDPNIFLFLLKEGSVKSPFENDELVKFCYLVLQNNFHIILRRYFKTEDKIFFKICEDEIEAFSIARGIIKKDSNLTVLNNPSDLLISFYNDMKNIIPIHNQGLEVLIGKEIQEIKEEKCWQDEIIEEIKFRILKEASSFVDNVILQGSFATRDFISNWSDLDLILFLKDETFSSKDKLLYFKKKIEKISLLVYKIDPLAHHEFMFFTDFDKNSYPSNIFPPNLFEYSRVLLGGNKLYLSLRDESKKNIFSLIKFISHFRNKILKENVSVSSFSWKNDLSLIMLFPSLLLESVNINLYKKFSFEKVKEKFSDLDFSVIDTASKMRIEWRGKNLLRFYPNIFFRILPPWFSKKIINLHRRVFDFKAISEGESIYRMKIYQSFLLLAEQSIKKILN